MSSDMYHLSVPQLRRKECWRSGDTYMRGPLFVARSAEMGNAKASGRGASNGIGTTLFVYKIIRVGAGMEIDVISFFK